MSKGTGLVQPMSSIRLRRAGIATGGLLFVVVGYHVLSTTSSSLIAPDPGEVRPTAEGALGADASSWIDCVGVLNVINLRGIGVANAHRFGEDASADLRTNARLRDLAPADLRNFCDWEACIRANGYAHVCGLADAGGDASWESCRVCADPSDCSGRPVSQDDCVAHASDPGRAQCHVGLLQECLLQQALRGPADQRVTQSCQRSEEACAGDLPGDLTTEALEAQTETGQVTIEEFKDEVAVEAKLDPESKYYNWPYWQGQLALWEGGLPPGEDAGEASLDASDGD